MKRTVGCLLSRVPYAVLAVVLLGAATLPAQQRVGELYATDAGVKGSVVLAGSGTSVLSGSSIEAGLQSATLKLERGGNVLVCPGTRLAVTASQNGRELMLSLNSGNVVLDYPMGAAADTLLTPDLRLLMPGPGTLHAAVRVDANGDTCVQSLPSNATAIVVSETLGDATYQVRPESTVMFQGGRIGSALPVRTNCGCPAPPPSQVAKAAPPPPPPPAAPEAMPAPPAAKPAPEVAEQHMTVEAPFVFKGDDPEIEISSMVVTLKLERNQLVQLETVVVPPPGKGKHAASQQGKQSAAAEHKRGFLRRLFAALFG